MPVLSDLGAGELVAGFAGGAFSPIEAVEAAAVAIDRRDRGLRAFAALCLDRARGEAVAADRAYREGTARPLEGLPLAVKDLIDVGGVETTYGSPMFAANVPAADAEAVRRARAAGVIVVGKTATHEFAWGTTSQNDHFDWGRNPWDPARVSGGSSGGSAVALAAGMVPLALGTDTGGSIRIPAAYCGVCGHKPSFGLVPTSGVFPLAPSLDHVGPLARSPLDAALLLEALAGLPSVPLAGDLQGVRVGVCADLVPPLAPGPAAALAAAEDALTGLGARRVECALPEAAEILPAFGALQQAEALRAHRAAHLWPGRSAEYGRDVRGRLENAAAIDLDAYVAATAVRERVRASFTRLFRDADVLLTPVIAGAPPLRGEDEVDHLGARVPFRQVVMALTTPQNLAGLPAAAVRAGFDELGIPCAVQLTGPPGSDRAVLGVAQAVWEATAELQARRSPAWS